MQTYFNAVPTFPGGAFTTAGSFFNSTTTPVGYVYRAIGVRGEAQLSCSENLGVYGLAITPAQGTPKNYGVYGEASGGITNYGVYGKSLLPTTNNYGVYGEALNGVFNYGVYAKCATFAPTHWALYCDGRGFIPGGFWTASDSKLKNNITVLAPEEAINLIKQFSPKKYEFNSTDYPSFNFPTGEQYGLMADELESILPQFVTDAVHPSVQDSTGNEIYPAVSFKAVNYQALVPILIQGVKDQQAQIEAQKEQIATLTSALDEIKSYLGLSTSSSTIADSTGRAGNGSGNTADYMLNQNTPNPFDEGTEIKYHLAEAGQAVITVYSLKGEPIKTLRDSWTETGWHTLTWNAEDLANGVYFYTLKVNGKELFRRAILVRK